MMRTDPVIRFGLFFMYHRFSIYLGDDIVKCPFFLFSMEEDCFTITSLD